MGLDPTGPCLFGKAIIEYNFQYYQTVIIIQKRC